MTQALCPECGGLFGPTVNSLLSHLRERHNVLTQRLDLGRPTRLFTLRPGPSGAVLRNYVLEFVAEATP